MGALAISAIGLATPLGGALQSAAASRAGVARPSPAPDESTMSPGDEAPQPVPVHALASATFGFCGVGRLVALLVEALVDLDSRVPLATLGADTRLFLALPDPAQRAFEVASPAGVDPEEADARVAALGRLLVARAGETAGVDLARFSPTFQSGDELAFSNALRAAHQVMATRTATRALVCAADSLAAPDALDHFASDGRVRDGDRPNGFVPGEAAGAILLEAPPRGAPAVLVGEPVFAEDRWRFGADVPPDGRSLADCLTRAAGAAGGPVVILSDFDGEQHRARELGVARVLLGRRNAALAGAEAWYPATSFGRTGAASGLVATVLAHQAFERRYAPAPRFAILSAADDGRRSAFVTSRTEP